METKSIQAQWKQNQKPENSALKQKQLKTT